MKKLERRLLWVGTSKDDLLKLPVDVQKFFGHALEMGMDIIRSRLKVAERLAREQPHDKADD